MNPRQSPASNERNIDEIKVEAQARAERGAYPLIGLDPMDVRQALAHIETRDVDEWASAWSAVADRYYGVAREVSERPGKTIQLLARLATLLFCAVARRVIGRQESRLQQCTQFVLPEHGSA